MIKLKNILNEAKVIKVKFNDNDQTLYFSDGEKSKVDYDGEFKYKGKWFDTSDMNSAKDLEKMLSKAFPGTKFIQTESVNESTPNQVIKDLDKAKNDLLKKVDALIAKKKKLYSDVDIEAPMSADEKKLDKDIADLFSQINKLVLQKRSVKKESVNEEKVYIDFLNKKKGFKQDRIRFNSYEAAVKWAKKNFERFHPDMIKFESVNEENEPTNPALWDKAIAAAKRKYDVYPSAYANAFASKWYKEKGGDWKTKKESVTESAKSEKLASLINNVIDKVDSSLSYKDFAMAVGKILKDEYGSHLYSSFVQELNKELKRENENIKLTSLMTTESNDSIREALTISIRNLINDLVPRDIQNAITPQQQERRSSFVRDLVKTLNQFYKQNRVDWRFADSNVKFKMYSKD